MGYKIVCDICDEEVTESYITVVAPEGFLPAGADEDGDFQFCSWECVRDAALHFAPFESADVVSAPPQMTDEQVREAWVAAHTQVEQEDAQDEQPVKLRLKRAPRQANRFELNTTPLEQRREPRDDIPFGGVHRR